MGIECLCWTCRAQVDASTPGWFVFDVPGLDVPDGSPTDMSWLNTQPAGASGFLRCEGGHFVDGKGRRVRLIGTNLTGDACFPEESQAPRLATRLAQLGFNVVRMHFMDIDGRDVGIWKDPKDTAGGGLHPGRLRRLDRLVSELAKQGIYANINLHVARHYPGQPMVPGDQTMKMGKTLDRWYPPYVALLEGYARELLGHVNEFTGRRYADEPAVACVEINNENTVIKDIRNDYRAHLTGPLREAFCQQWTAWLKVRYVTTAQLAASWNREAQPLGTELLQPGGWSVQNGGGAKSALEQQGGRMVWRIERAGSEGWHLQLQRKNLAVKAGRHTLRLRARASEPQRLGASVMLDTAPWGTRGLSGALRLTGEWQEFTLTADIEPAVPPAHLRLNFSAEQKPAVIEMEAVSLRSGGGVGLPDGQSIERGVDIPAADAVSAVVRDFTAFLIDAEMSTTRRMVKFLKSEVGCRMPISDTQISYGGPAGVLRETELCDYSDIHGYWQHPSYTRNERGWTVAFKIPNSSQVASAEGGTLGFMALHRVDGRPFSVSEYNTPAPNDHSAELFPLLASIGALQDWDALYSYTYRDFGNDYDNTALKGYFHLIGRACALVHAPAAAILFRETPLPPSKGAVHLTLRRDAIPELVYQHKTVSDIARDAGIATGVAWLRRVTCSIEAGDGPPNRAGDGAVQTGVRSSDGGAMRWFPDDPAGPWFSLNAPSVRFLVGHVGGRAFEVGDVRFEIASRPWPRELPAYACVSLVSIDRKPIAESKRLLLAASARTEGQSMPWDQARTSLPAGKWGTAPSISEAVPLDLTLPGPGGNATALDATGRPAGCLKTVGRTITLRAEDRTLWAVIERP